MWCDKIVSGLNLFLRNKVSYHCYLFQSSILGTTHWVQWLCISSEHIIKSMVWNLASVSCSLVWIMLTQISLPLAPCWVIWEKKEVIWHKIRWVGRLWNDSSFVFRFGHEFGGNPAQFHIVFQNALNSPKWNSLHVSNFTGTESSVWKNTFLPVIHVFLSILLIDGCPEHSPWT